MKFDTNTLTTIAVATLVISLIGLIIVSSMMYKETFSPKYEPKMEDHVSASFDVSTDPNVLSHGTVKRHKVGNEYTYEFLYNLPDSSAPFQMVAPDKPFNQPLPMRHYVLYLGDKDKKNMERISKIHRSSDGWHKKTLKSKKKYEVACLTLGDSLVSCVDIV
jgi:hypothetical protein